MLVSKSWNKWDTDDKFLYYVVILSFSWADQNNKELEEERKKYLFLLQSIAL